MARVVSRVVALVAGVALTMGLAAPPAAAGPRQATSGHGPWQPTILHAMAHGLSIPDAAPPGANDWNCRPTPERPHPVVLVHGTFLNAYNSWAALSPVLADAGYCVFAVNYGADPDHLPSEVPGVRGIGDIRESADDLALFVDEVLAATGAPKVDLVGHSQGGLLSRYYVTVGGGADPDSPERSKVRSLVSLAGSYHGTTVFGIATMIRDLQEAGVGDAETSRYLLGTSTGQQIAGSDFLRDLDSHGDTVPGVRYLAVATRYDEVVTPYHSQLITPGPGAEVRNVTLQDGCELDTSEHGSVIYSRRVFHEVRAFLGDPNVHGPAPCDPTLILAQAPPP